MAIEVVAAQGAWVARAVGEMPELVQATGPASYRYIFDGPGPVYEPFIKAAWTAAGNFFSHAQSTLALEGDAFLGVLISHDGPEHYALKDAVFPIAQSLIGSHGVTMEHIVELSTRADIASYMNPHVPNDCSYIIVVSVPEAARGRGAGRALMVHEIERARAKGFRTVHLDVMSDNPAVGLYQSLGFEIMAETITPIPCRQHGIAMELRMVLTL
jgi:ribosomal protein S18 acetylase RimI-like enzyme